MIRVNPHAFRKFDESLSQRDIPIIAHGFNRGFSDVKTAEPRRGERSVSPNKRFLSSLTGLVSFAHKHPAMNRRAIFCRPCRGSNPGHSPARRDRFWRWRVEVPKSISANPCDPRSKRIFTFLKDFRFSPVKGLAQQGLNARMNKTSARCSSIDDGMIIVDNPDPVLGN